jgi:hypothetical protein
MPLNKREYICPFCGMIKDRDHNAALNIFKRATELFNNKLLITKDDLVFKPQNEYVLPVGGRRTLNV